jgi:hypothetical protein
LPRSPQAQWYLLRIVYSDNPFTLRGERAELIP